MNWLPKGPPEAAASSRNVNNPEQSGSERQADASREANEEGWRPATMPNQNSWLSKVKHSRLRL